MKTFFNFITSSLRLVRLWGVKGIIGYAVRQIRNRKTSRFFLDNARRYSLVPERGITILADMTNPSSLSKVMRDLAYALKRAGIPFQVYNLHPNCDFPSSDIAGVLTPPADFRILKYDHVIEMFSSPVPKCLPLKRARIVFWEFTTGLLEYNPSIANASTVIAMSDFNYDVFRQTFPKTVKVRKVLYPFFFDSGSLPERGGVRRKYGIPENAFVVFFNFDYASSFGRKNPDGCVRAFAKAFPRVEDAVLVFKTKGAANHQEDRRRLVELAEQLGVGDRMVMIDDFIPLHDIYGLTEACDVYLSLHRGEGFGLGIAEAMSLGKPVVVTNYSSTTEFCKPENSIPVSYSVVDVPESMHDLPCYHYVKEWAEPNIDEAAAAISKLYHNPTLRKELGNAAKAFIAENFSVGNFRKSIEAFLCEE